MKRKYGMVLGILLAIAALLGATGCVQPAPEPTKTVEPAPQPIEPPKKPPHPPIKSTGNVFYSTQGDFAFNIPTKWKNNCIVEERPSHFPTADWETSFIFAPGGIKSADGKPLLTVIRLPKAAYNTMIQKGGSKPGILLKTNEKYVWIGLLPSSNPYDPMSQKGKQFQSLLIDYQILRSYFVS
jgi:hypothetical protein